MLRRPRTAGASGHSEVQALGTGPRASKPEDDSGKHLSEPEHQSEIAGPRAPSVLRPSEQIRGQALGTSPWAGPRNEPEGRQVQHGVAGLNRRRPLRPERGQYFGSTVS